MKCFLFFILTCFAAIKSIAQFKNDNVLYKTVDPLELCKALQKNPGYLLLDVRSPGEYHDTSRFHSLNLGYLDGAINIDIREAGQRLDEISEYKRKPVFVYCSHSQRSRRVSKMLADSGFTNVYNINGGMTALHYMDRDSCLVNIMRSNNSYNIISPGELCRKLINKKIFLLDVRPDSVWSQSGSDSRSNSFGYLKGTKHIALTSLKDNINLSDKDMEIVITDISGSDAANAAAILKENGFKNVSVLIEGIDRWMAYDKKKLGCKDIYQAVVPFHIINSYDLNEYSINNDIIYLDCRTTDEFRNSDKNSYKNIGHLKNAIHIPAADLEMRLNEIEKFKSRPIIVYAFSGTPEAFASAGFLAGNGFKDVKLLTGGLFNIRWTAANVAGMKGLNNLLVDVPEENK